MEALPMAVARRFTIGTLMAVVFLIAADFGIVRALWWTSGPQVEVVLVTLPMIDLLLLTLPKLMGSNPTRPFWGGFQVVGWIGGLTTGLLAWAFAGAIFWPIDSLHRMNLVPDGAAGIALVISIVVVLYTTPMLLFALLAGRLSAKYRIVIERR